MILVLCPICKKSESQFLRNAPVSKVELYYCLNCRVRFSHPMKHPGQEWYESSDIYEEVRWNLPKLSKLGKRWEFSKAIGFLKSDTKTVLDVGCGRGDFLKLAESKGYLVSGIDLNETLIRVAKEAYGLEDVHHSTFEDFFKITSKKKMFDVITAFEVLEHLPKPDEFIRVCAANLNPGGFLILSVPGFHRMPKWVNSSVDMPPHHLVLWSEKGLKILLESQGFKNVRIERKPLLLNDIMYHAVRVIPHLQKPGHFFKLLRGFLKILIIPYWLFLSLHPRAGGFTYLSVGQK